MKVIITGKIEFLNLFDKYAVAMNISYLLVKCTVGVANRYLNSNNKIKSTVCPIDTIAPRILFAFEYLNKKHSLKPLEHLLIIL